MHPNADFPETYHAVLLEESSFPWKTPSVKTKPAGLLVQNGSRQDVYTNTFIIEDLSQFYWSKLQIQITESNLT